jgi:hypothetical protein
MGGDPRNLITMAGVFLIFAAVAVLWVREKGTSPASASAG